MATKQVSVRMAAVGGKQVKAELIDIGTAGQRSFRQLDQSARVGGGGLQNLGFQVQDFAVQVAGGTDASRALAQQLPQLLSGFGLFGVLVGTASAVLIPFAGYLFGASEEVLTLEERLDNLSRAMGDLQSATKTAETPIENLLATYGEYADQAQRVAEINRQLAYLDAASALSATAGAITGMFGDLERLNAEGEETPVWLREIEARFGNLNPDSVRNVAEALSISTEQAILLTEQMVALSEAQGPEAQVEALKNVISQLELATGGAFEMDEATRAVYQSLLNALKEAQALAAIDLASGVGIAADEAARLASNLFAARQQQIAADGKVYSGRGGDPRTSNLQGVGAFKYDGPALDINNVPVVRRGGGGGGGGGRVSNDEREAQRIYEQTRTEAEKYAAELEKINALHESGALSTDTYNRALEQLKEKTKDATSDAERLNDAFRGTFESIVTGSNFASEALSALFDSLASQLANSAFDGLNTAIFGEAGIGGLFGGIFGGGKAAGGPVRAGMSYMVGEYGPERITMAGNGYVTNNADLRRAATSGGGGVSITVNAQGAVEGVAAQVRRTVQGLIPDIVRASVDANRAQAARGR